MSQVVLRPRCTLCLYSGRKRSPDLAAGGSSTPEVRGIAPRAVSLPERGMLEVIPCIEARLALGIF